MFQIAEPVTTSTGELTDLLRDLRANGMEPHTMRRLRNGNISVKFVGATARYWARRISWARPDAVIVQTADGAEVALVIVRLEGQASS